MKKNIIGLVLSVFGLVSATVAELPPAPKARVSDPVYQFGAVSQGTKVQHDFVIENQGQADLHIQRVVAACGCTAAAPEQDKVAPGSSTKIQVTFDSTGFSGDKIKSVRVYTNDIDNSTIMLSLQGSVEPEVEVEPSRVFLGDIIKGGADLAKPTRVSVRVHEGAKGEILDARTFSPYITVKQIEQTKKSRVLELSVNPDAPLGELRDRVVVSLSGASTPTINIPIFASVKGPIKLEPTTLSFGIIEGDQSLDRKIKIENLGPDPVTIEKLAVNNPAVTTSLKPIKEGRIYVLDVKVDPSKVTTDLRSSITFETHGTGAQAGTPGSHSVSVYGVLPPKV